MQVSRIVWHKKFQGNTAAGIDDAPVNGEALDLTALGTFSRARLILELGAVTESGKLMAVLQESESEGGEFTNVAGLEETGEDVTGKSDTSIVIDVPAVKRFLRYAYQRSTANIELDSVTIELYSSTVTTVRQSGSVWREIIR